MQIRISNVYACLAVTCHLYFCQNDWDPLRVTAVTRGWNGYRNKRHSRQWINSIKDVVNQTFQSSLVTWLGSEQLNFEGVLLLYVNTETITQSMQMRIIIQLYMHIFDFFRQFESSLASSLMNNVLSHTEPIPGIGTFLPPREHVCKMKSCHIINKQGR